MKKVVLDPCCGARSFYFQKNHDKVHYCDIRKGMWAIGEGRSVVVDPDQVVDFKNLPFEDESFYHVVFDPPHFVKAGKSGWMYKRFGKLDENTWQEDIKQGFSECWRVLKKNGTLVFKWSDYQLKLSEVLECIPVEPLYGSKNNRTSWLTFVKFEEKSQDKA